MWLGLGSNQGDRRSTLAAALNRIGAVCAIEAVSSVYESEPVGLEEQADFWNLVIRVRTTLEPPALLAALKSIETDLGRRAGIRWGPRPIDIDILLYGDRIVRDAVLEIPHPRMLERGFVLRPLAEIDPDRVHPVSGERIETVMGAGSYERSRRLFPGTELMQERGS